MRRSRHALPILLIGPAAVLAIVLSGADGPGPCESADATATAPPGRIIPAAERTAATAAPAIELITVATGERGELLLEWTGGPDNATRWQFRHRLLSRDGTVTWSWWTDVPGSDASTDSLCLIGLLDYRAYDFEVRAVVGTEAGVPSEPERAVTPEFGSDGIPHMYHHEQIVEGGRRWRVLDVVIDVPAGVRLMRYGGSGGMPGGGRLTVNVYDVESGSRFTMDPYTGEMLGRVIVTTPASSRDVGAVFDGIAASARVLPRAGAAP